jgi:hypothetical protein
MPIDPGEGMGKLPAPAEPDVPVLTDGPDPEGVDAELEELLGELDELEPLLEDELFDEELLEEELLEEELLGGDITGRIDTDGIDGVVGMLALGQPVSVITTAVMQQTSSTR